MEIKEEVNNWWINLQTIKRFELMKKYEFKNPNYKILLRIYKIEKI